MATEGARSSNTEAGREEQWENVLSSTIGELGIDPNGSFADDSTGTEAVPQGEAQASSAEATPATPATPQPSATADYGTSAATAQVPAAEPSTPEAPDDLTTAKPFDFTVNGETRTIDGTYRIPGEGLIVPEEHVARFQQMASHAASSEARIQALYTEAQQAKQRDETWNRLSTWQIQGPDGQPQAVTGERGIAEMRAAANRSSAIASVIGTIFDDPTQAAKLTTDIQGNDGQWFRMWNPDAIAGLQARASVAALQADRTVLGQLSQLRAPPPPSAPSDADIQSSAPATVDAVISSLKLTGLTDQDKQFLTGLVPRYVRATRPEDQFNGPRIVDASFLDVVKDRAAIRAEAAKAAQTAATSAAAAQKFNNGMANGTKKPVAAPRPAAPAAPAPERRTKASDWQSVLEQALPNANSLSSLDDVGAALNT